MPTMKDVARRAGVSLGTVSNVLNNRASVQPENRDRVLKAVEELGFKANMVARALKTKSSNDIALIIPNIDNPFYPEVARGVEDAANKAGFQVFLCNSDRTLKKEQAYLDSLLTKNIDGIILVKPQLQLEALERISERMAVVLVDTDLPWKPGYNMLHVDDKDGFLRGLQLFDDFGHTRIAMIGGMMESLSSNVRYQTYKTFMEQRGLPLRKEYVIKGDYSWSSGYKAAKVFMDLREPPTAIFAANDLMAIGAMKALREKGLRVPEDVSVMGYDNVDMTKLCTPTLTTVNQPKYELGVKCMEMLLRRLERMGGETEDKAPDDGELVVLPAHVVVRESVGPVKE